MLSIGFCHQHHKDKEVTLCMQVLKPSSLSGFMRWFRVLCQELWFSVCVWSQIVCQWEVKRVAGVVKASCLLMSSAAEWMRTQMGFLSGLFFWPGPSVFGETRKALLELTATLLKGGRHRSFTLLGLNWGWRKNVSLVGVSGDGISEVNGPWGQHLSFFHWSRKPHKCVCCVDSKHFYSYK